MNPRLPQQERPTSAPEEDVATVPVPSPGNRAGDRAGDDGGHGLVAATVAVLFVVVAVFGGILWSIWADARPGTIDTARRVAKDLRTWDLINYRGKYVRPDSTDLQIDVTVDPDGDAAGTLTTADGARAEYARIDGVELLRAEPSWFHDDRRSEDGIAGPAGRWVKNPSEEFPGLDFALLTPGALAGRLDVTGSSLTSPYEERDSEQVDGQQARLLEGRSDLMLISQGSTPRLLAIRQGGVTGSSEPLLVAPGRPSARTVIDAARTTLSTAPDYRPRSPGAPPTGDRSPADARLSTGLTVRITWAPDATTLCTAAKCSATVTVTNPEAIPARGTLTISLNGTVREEHPYRLEAGGSTTFTTTVDNPATPGTEIPMNWIAEARPY